ncbi:MAG: ATP-binding protein, partial [Planctomycetes bacterium]|nr:ATP-binding protein [Planctomycetota bacterium]
MMAKFKIENPFRPGAGHMPPYLAGRETETREFRKVLDQTRILENPVLTGLRGLGKTVLLETFKPMAIQAGWLWAGTDLSESTSISEEHLAIRLITDLSVVTASVVISGPDRHVFGFSHKTEKTSVQLDFATLQEIFVNEPGLIIDKLKAVLERVWPHIQK